MRRWARDAEARTLANYANPNNNYTGLCAPDRYYIGFLGQVAFKSVLLTYGKWFHDSEGGMNDGFADRQDFLVEIGARRMKLDVKTNSNTKWNDLLIPAKQFRKCHREIYVGASLIGIDAEIQFNGWATRLEVEMGGKDKRLLIPTRLLECEHLSNIESLISILE